jgi:hypothetical protein
MVVKWQAASLIITTTAIALSVTLTTYTINRTRYYVSFVYDNLLIKTITEKGDSRNGTGFSIAAIGCAVFHKEEEALLTLLLSY